MSDGAAPPTISVVFSFRNERDNIPPLVARLDAMFSSVAVDYELIFVNDASDDFRSRARRATIAQSAVKVVNMSRPVRCLRMCAAGMAAASGDATIVMDADLQDPPEVIPQLIEKWRAGADVVIRCGPSGVARAP